MTESTRLEELFANESAQMADLQKKLASKHAANKVIVEG